jgi:hypothetical protein
MDGHPPTNSIGPNQGAEVSLPPAVQPGVKLVKKLIRRKKLKEATMLQQPNNQKKPVQSATGSPQPSPQEVMAKKQEAAKAAQAPATAPAKPTSSTQATAKPSPLQQKANQVAKQALQKKIALQKQAMANQIQQQKLAAKNPGLNN